ncbi:putative motility protein [Paenibacillus sp. BIHB 4019]|uniref:Putative motility protein n=1 Tax=Paenibacillus sp. BIHB 4019 TaxID=1870819 RepID=A0A1B2DQA8_9BACL|nr:YjfB family protein [Paenibacillus sp. BIHB 4019]ANY69885.1 putative motility protein [Paenibacillus sp. BIHB 4019]
MDIAALSTSLSQSSLGTAVSVRMLDIGQDQMQVQAQGLIKMMELSVNPNVGSLLDIKV